MVLKIVVVVGCRLTIGSYIYCCLYTYTYTHTPSYRDWLHMGTTMTTPRAPTRMIIHH